MANAEFEDPAKSVVSPAGTLLLNSILGSSGSKRISAQDMFLGSLFNPSSPAPSQFNQQGTWRGMGSPMEQVNASLGINTPNMPQGQYVSLPGGGGFQLPGNMPQQAGNQQGGGNLSKLGGKGGTYPYEAQEYDPSGIGMSAGAIQDLIAGRGVAPVSQQMTNALYATQADWLNAANEGAYAFANALEALQGDVRGAAAGGGFGYRNPDGSLANSRALFNEMKALQNESAANLNAAIDAEASRGIAMELPEVRAQMEAAGLGRSGAATNAAGGVISDIMGQANRDKIRSMTELEEANLGRLQNTLLSGEELRLRGLGMEADTRSRGIESLKGIHAYTDNLKRQRLYDMLGIGEQQRAVQQQGLNQSFDARMMPLNLLLQMATGSPARPVQNVQASNPWAGFGAQVGGQMAGGMLGGGGYNDQYYGGTA